LLCSTLGNECLFSAYGFKFLAFPLVQMELGSCPFSRGEEQQKKSSIFGYAQVIFKLNILLMCKYVCSRTPSTLSGLK
jgi:hypothetical protein